MMKKLISLEGIWAACLVFAVLHMIFRTGEQDSYIAAAFVVFAMMRLEDFLKKNLTF